MNCIVHGVAKSWARLSGFHFIEAKYIPTLLNSTPGYTLNEHLLLLFIQSCPTVCDPMNWSPSGSSVHGVLQARTLECVAISSSICQKYENLHNVTTLNWK